MALERYAAIDSIGMADVSTYERLTEVSHLLGDSKLFVRYAEKQAEVHPGDRELYNLGLAYFGAGNHQKTIETQKSAIQKYPHSPHIGGFYRLLGDGYYEIGRQQTAERTYQEGVKAVELRVADLKGTNPQFSSTAEYRQLADSRRAMLLSLKKLYRLHGKTKELDEVELLLEKDP
jgi:tetratricopeptide (TPR) repeat protein